MNRTEELKLRFHDFGYMVIPQFYVKSTISAVSELISHLSGDATSACGVLKIMDKSVTGETILNRLENTINDSCNELGKLIINDKLIEILTSLFDGQKPIIFKDKINFKPPGCRADLIHQDQASGWNRYSDYFISVCISIDENSQNNGAMRFLSTGNYPKSLMTDDWEPVTFDDPETLPRDQYQIVEINPGDIVIFDSYIPHGSPINHSDSFRRNIFLTFNSASKGELRQRYYEDRKAQYPPGSFI